MPVGCPLRCGPGLILSVDHGGKLLERLKVKESLYSDELDWPTNPGISLLPATKKLKLADPATESIRSGITAVQGGFFCYFSCPSRKVK